MISLLNQWGLYLLHDYNDYIYAFNYLAQALPLFSTSPPKSAQTPHILSFG